MACRACVCLSTCTFSHDSAGHRHMGDNAYPLAASAMIYLVIAYSVDVGDTSVPEPR